MKVNTPGKIVPYKCCPPSLNIGARLVLTQMVFLTNITHFQVLSVTFIEYGQKVNKHDVT